MSAVTHELYHTDLFQAILDNKSRGHPILKALLFLYCPMAVKLWLNGIDPTVPYDPVWDALTEFASDTTLKQVLEERRGFSETKEAVVKYFHAVDAFQETHPGEFPDPRQVFPGMGKARLPFRYQKGSERFFGGDFRNVELFIRAWVFILIGWKRDAGVPPESRFLAEKLVIKIPGLDTKPIAWPAWSWAINADPTRMIVGLLANEGDQDQLLFSLADFGIASADKTRKPTSCEYLPTLLILNRNGRRTLPFQPVFDPDKLMKLILEISETIQETVCLPLAAINNRRQCVHCGFHDSCFSEAGDIRPEILSRHTSEKDWEST